MVVVIDALRVAGTAVHRQSSEAAVTPAMLAPMIADQPSQLRREDYTEKLSLS